MCRHLEIAAHQELDTEAALSEAIELTPVSIALTASADFQFYSGGMHL